MKKHHNVFSNDGKIGSQYQNFAHLLYRQNARMEVGVNPGGAIAVSSYKSQQQAQNYANGNNTKTVAVANFPNGRVTTTLQNSYSNNNYSRTHLSTNTIKNYRVQSNGRQNIKEAELANNSFSRSKSVYKDQDWARNGTSVSRSTASHSSGLPPAIKKSSSISADYGKNQTQSYQYSQINNNTKMINHTKIRMSSNSSGRSAMNTSGQPTSVEPAINPSMSGTGRSNEKAWTLKGSNIQADPAAGAKINPTVSTGNIPNSKSVSQTRPDSKKLTALNRPPSGSSLFPQKVPNPVSEIGGGIGECTVIHVIDEAKKKQKDFKGSMNILLKYMKYFEKHLKATESTDDIDISVHGDVVIFEWLLNYIEQEERKEMKDEGIKFYEVVTKDGENYKVEPNSNKRRKPVFEIGNAISILISSDYLKMNKLVDDGLDYFIENIDEILRLPIDMSCIASHLQRKLSIKMADEQIDKVSDK